MIDLMELREHYAELQLPMLFPIAKPPSLLKYRTEFIPFQDLNKGTGIKIPRDQVSPNGTFEYTFKSSGN